MKLSFSPADIFKAPRIALSFQRIWIQLIGLITGYGIYIITSYLALSLNGFSLAKIWLVYRLFPFFPANCNHWLGWSVYLCGICLVVYVQLLAATAVSRGAYMFLKGHSFYTWREAWRFALRKKGALFFAPAALIVLISCFFITGWFLGLVGTIPWAGPLIFASMTTVLVLCSLLLLFLIILLGGTILFIPAILATTDEDAFEVIFQTIALVWHQPWRLLGSQLTNSIVSVFSLVVLAFFTKKAVLLLISIYRFPLVVSESFQTNLLNFTNQAFALLQQWLENLTRLLELIPNPWCSLFKAGVYLNHHYPSLNKALIGPENYLAAMLVAVSLLFVGSAVLSFGIATFNVGNTMTYLAMRYRKDQANLLERQDAEEQKSSAHGNSEGKENAVSGSGEKRRV